MKNKDNALIYLGVSAGLLAAAITRAIFGDRLFIPATILAGIISLGIFAYFAYRHKEDVKLATALHP